MQGTLNKIAGAFGTVCFLLMVIFGLIGIRGIGTLVLIEYWHLLSLDIPDIWYEVAVFSAPASIGCMFLTIMFKGPIEDFLASVFD